MKKLLKNKKNVVLLIYILVCIAVLLFRVFPIGRYSVEKVNYGSSKSTKYDLQNGTIIETEFLMDSEYLSGIGFYYLSNGFSYDTDEKIKIDFYLDDEKVESSEVLLSEQTDETEIFVPFERTGVKGKKIQIRLYSQNLSEGKYPALGASEETNTQMHLFVNNEMQDATLMFAAYYRVSYTPDVKIYFDFVIALLAGIFIWCLVKCNVLTVSGTIVRRNEKKKRKDSLFKDDLRKLHKQKKLLLGYVLVLVGMLVLLEYTYHYGVKDTAYIAKKSTVYQANSNGKYLTLNAGDYLSQDFKSEDENLSAFSIQIAEGAFEKGKDHILVRLIRTGDSALIFENRYSLLEVQEKNDSTVFLSFDFPQIIHDSKEQNYTLYIEVLEGFSGELKVLLSSENGQQMTSGTIGNGTHSFNVFLETSCLTNLFLKQLYKMLCIVLIILMSVIYFACYFYRKHYYKLFIPVVLSFGIVYCTLIPVYMTPDEPSHIDTAYRISNQIMGYGNPDGSSAIYKRVSDINAEPPIEITVDTYREFIDSFWLRCSNDTLQATYGRNNIDNARSVFYLPAALGITVGRMLGLGKLLTYTLARLFGLFAATFMMYIGIKAMPFGKMVFFAIALFPMTLQQLMSVSYDSIIIGIVYMYIGYCLKWAYTDAKIKLAEACGGVVLAILLASVKGGVYLPISFLVFLVPVKKYGWNKKTLIGLGSISMLLILFFLSANSSIFMRLGHASGGTVSAANDQALYSLSYFINQPVELFRIIENSLYEQGDTWFRTMFGSGLGWLNIQLQWLMVISFFILLLLSSIIEEGEKLHIKVGTRIWFLLLSSGSFGLILISMLISWTPVTSKAITGVQGRYFLPFIGLVFLAVRNPSIVWKRDNKNCLVLAGCILNIFAITQIILVVF